MIFSKKTFYSYTVFLFIFFLTPLTAFSASISLSPGTTSVSAGNIFTVNVVVNTEGKIINNAETEIQFPTEFLEVVSIDRSSSIFSLWVDEPTFSNISGKISFNGGVPNPGYQGASGKVLSIVFRAKKAGAASMVFVNSAIRENDGLGTDILTAKFGSNISITSTPTTPVVEKPTTPTTQTVGDLVVTSPTHPNQKSWYNKNDVELFWKLPADATAVKTLLGSFPNSAPTVLYSNPISSKSINNLEDGTWYFHINYLGTNGWSNVTHFKIQVDTQNPKNISVNTSIDESGRVTLSAEAEDDLSGIDYYSVVVDSNPSFIIKADENGRGQSNVPITSVGDHSIVVRVYDRAGNVAEKIVSITTNTVTAVSIDSYPVKIKVGENIEISGTAPYSGAKVSISVKKDNVVVESYKLTADSYSKFNFKSQQIENPGIYTVWADVLDSANTVSASSQRINIEVIKPIMLQIGSYTTELLSVLVPAVVLILILLLSLYYGWYKFLGLRRKIRKDFDQMHERVHRAFRLLSTETAKQLEILEKSRKKAKLSASEQAILDEIKDSVNQIDLYVETQLKNIEDKDLK